MRIQIKRIYEVFSIDDGYRVLVDRFWPGGVKKEEARIDEWLKGVAPSQALIKWFGHQPEKWDSFYARYLDELFDSAPLAHLMDLMEKHNTLTLLYSAKDELHNHAIVIRDFLLLTP
ncbi:DUF488 domain-containing protein [Parapedobacter indicus]|uniref:Uncharacterized conserved protein YeaO, DUF488 family n=1 Tax=Parapedobacter indicus TaxID=1477437 RepID=A0A1I3VCR8_9SPHI|nr:DUF488 domain-containing protein [Parapedobacter indicus]PPK98905.1 uncharacterized protein YeaO (DUF488 family) [Parapedobacter indicus]SFJ93264.1 Uncharacterized conserved protein YeaO, DUF488 family [Parapedobacter indicus]